MSKLSDLLEGIYLNDFNNPIASKTINNVTYRITFEGDIEKGKKYYRLYANKKLIDKCSSVEIAKSKVNTRETDIVTLNEQNNMAKAINLELYEGDLNGVYQKLWVVTSENGNYFTVEPQCLVWKNLESRNPLPDFKESKLVSVTNEKHHYITHLMTLKRHIDPRTGLDKPIKAKPKDKSMSKGM